MTLFSHSDIDGLRNAKLGKCAPESKFCGSIRRITAFDDKIVDLIESIQVLKESGGRVEETEEAFAMLRESKIEHEAQLSGAKQKPKLQNMSKALKLQLKKTRTSSPKWGNAIA